MKPRLFFTMMVLLFLLAISFREGFGFAVQSKYIPPDWEEMCKLATTTPSSDPSLLHEGVPFSAIVVHLDCSIPKSDRLHWKLNDLRTWTQVNGINLNTGAPNRTTVYNITVSCENGANVSLPWPMKVAGLLELRVTYCMMVDKYLNYNDPVTKLLPEEMRVLILRHSIWAVELKNAITDNATGSLNLTSDYECGQDSTYVIFVTSNISDVIQDDVDSSRLFSLQPSPGLDNLENLPTEPVDDVSSSQTVKPETRLIKDASKAVSDQQDFNSELELLKASFPKEGLDPNSTRDAQLKFLEILGLTSNTDSHCSYVKLKLIDESISHLTPFFHFEFMVQNADYPVLEIMNYSMFGLEELPRELQQWRRHFPKLRFLDLTYNYISEVTVPVYPSKENIAVTFDMRHNNISVISLDILKSWAKVEKFYVDIRDNPIHCGCEMLDFLPHLHNKETFTGDMAPYEYVRNLKCVTPEDLAGQQLYTLTKDSIDCDDQVSVYQTEALIAICVISTFFIMLIIVTIRFKAEIRILLYTRLHLRLPCDVDAQRNLKKYDAFVSYSNDDAAWVYENLLKYLESSQTKNPNSYTMNGSVGTNNNKTLDKDKNRTFKLCIHERDFIPGKTISDNIIDSIESSRHTIIVLSPSFMKSHWAMEELRQAYRQSLVEKTRHLIVLLLEKVPKDDMDPLISRCCKTFTYLDVSDSLFKDKLKFALTTKDRSAKRRDKVASRQTGTGLPKSPSTLTESPSYDNVAYSVYASPTISPTSVPDAFAYDNPGYTHYTGRPSEPIRELSNMSTSSTTPLASY